MTSPTLPGDRPALRGLLPVPLLTAALAALAVVVAAVLAPDSAHGYVAVVGALAAVALCAAVTVAVYARQSARAVHRRLESVTQDIGRLLQERARLAEESQRQHDRLTGELTRERARLTAELDQERTRLADAVAAERDRLTSAHTAETARLTEEHAAQLARLTEEHAAQTAQLTEDHAAQTARLTDEYATRTARLTEESAARTAQLTEERERLVADNARLSARLREATTARAATLSATANAAGRMQALATSMLADLRAMEERHADEEVLADLLHLDHRTAQAGRLADSVAVLTGARSGRRWARPIGMESILRGAMGRIGGYQRVRVHSTSETAVAGHAAEGVMHALAELLDNAANFSPPTAEVHVYVEEVPAGVIISVEDSGLVMGEAQLRRAERAVSGESADLGGLTGTRLGLTVVGKLAQRYGLKVSYRPSARGGTGVLMLVPQDILAPEESAGGTAPKAVNGTPSKAVVKTPETPRSTVPEPKATEPKAPEPKLTTETPTEAPKAAPPAAPTPAPDPHQLPRRERATTPTIPRTTPTPTPDLGIALDPDPTLTLRRDIDREPAPTHETAHDGPDPASEAAPRALPKRRRGRTLAEAERARSRGSGDRDATPRPAPTAEETRARTARFSSFREAVRKVEAQSGDSPTGPAAPVPTTPVSEGDTTT
ncbi:ATP-binding protein [Streptomyces flavalbus]|uniref:histidine kinase n=1 Tax=Streptomyces flavalbus TaxID=2665155 RepID=A0ABW2W8H7_9ACTN